MKIHEKLLAIQSTLKAPKGQYNSFGKYNYRNCEDILEAVKPLCSQLQCALTLSDEIVAESGRFYIKATAEIVDIESGESKKVTAFAREEETKKGMDGSQITGASSSYARKYALNGLFCIDDNKDSDTTNGKPDKPDKPQEISTECKKCGKEIKGGKKGDLIVTAQQISQSTGGFCIACAKHNENG